MISCLGFAQNNPGLGEGIDTTRLAKLIIVGAGRGWLLGLHHNIFSIFACTEVFHNKIVLKNFSQSSTSYLAKNPKPTTTTSKIQVNGKMEETFTIYIRSKRLIQSAFANQSKKPIGNVKRI